MIVAQALCDKCDKERKQTFKNAFKVIKRMEKKLLC